VHLSVLHAWMQTAGEESGVNLVGRLYNSVDAMSERCDRDQQVEINRELASRAAKCGYASH
jgi:hypothetical protein